MIWLDGITPDPILGWRPAPKGRGWAKGRPADGDLHTLPRTTSSPVDYCATMFHEVRLPFDAFPQRAPAGAAPRTASSPARSEALAGPWSPSAG
ncbi:hypothetical protein [Streptomyces rubiginosohelvolus]|uniref:hypothetical protein n=1 Tax=Streptomyces rubiginosohelvolus TaxID=67362 RepID=UPI00364916C3